MVCGKGIKRAPHVMEALLAVPADPWKSWKISGTEVEPSGKQRTPWGRSNPVSTDLRADPARPA